MTNATFNIPAMESIKELTNILMDGFLDINLKGYKILSILIIYYFKIKLLKIQNSNLKTTYQ